MLVVWTARTPPTTYDRVARVKKAFRNDEIADNPFRNFHGPFAN
jgi:hypothetical protein